VSLGAALRTLGAVLLAFALLGLGGLVFAALIALGIGLDAMSRRP